MKVVFVGIGIMGAGMAANIAKEHTVVAWNRTASKAVELANKVEAITAHEGTLVDCVKEIAPDVLVSMLSDGNTTDAAIFDSEDILGAISKGIIVCSSIRPREARKQAEIASSHALEYVDAPVSGGERGAVNGTLAIMAGGSEAGIQLACDVLGPCGRVVGVGPAGAGSVAKLANQVIVGGTINAIAEGLALAKSHGADMGQVRKALTGGFADSPLLQEHGLRMVKGEFEPGGPAKYMVKDLSQAKEAADEVGEEGGGGGGGGGGGEGSESSVSHSSLSLPILDAALARFKSMEEAELLEKDLSSVFLLTTQAKKE